MKATRLEPQKFSEYFKLPQNVDFDFLDIYAFQNIQLFLDPYGISAMGSKWARDSENNLLCYLYLENKTFINAHLIKTGLVEVDRNIDFKYNEKFQNLYNEVSINEIN